MRVVDSDGHPCDGLGVAVTGYAVRGKAEWDPEPNTEPASWTPSVPRQAAWTAYRRRAVILSVGAPTPVSLVIGSQSPVPSP